MIALKMNGHQIANRNRLIAFFDPLEMLRQRAAFASFAQAHLRLRSLDRYHVKVFQAVCALDVSAYPDAVLRNNYWGNPLKLDIHEMMLSEMLAQYQSEAFNNHPEKKAAVALTDSLAALVSHTQLPNREKFALFYLLCAGYLLVRATMESTPLETEAVTAAFLKLAPPAQAISSRIEQTNDSLHGITSIPQNSDDLILPARKEPYRFLLYTERILPDNASIHTVCVKAERARNGSRYLNIEIELYASEGDTKPTGQITLKAGEFIYANAVGSYLIKMLDTQVQNGSQRLERGNLGEGALTFRGSDGTIHKLSNSLGQRVSSFAVEANNLGYLLIDRYRLYTDWYTNRASYPQLSTVEYRRTVEVRFMGDDYLILQDNGRVYSSRETWNSLRRLSSLDYVNETEGQE